MGTLGRMGTGEGSGGGEEVGYGGKERGAWGGWRCGLWTVLQWDWDEGCIKDLLEGKRERDAVDCIVCHSLP